MYLVCGGEEALDNLAADYLSSMDKWNRQPTAHNDDTRRAVENAERRNAKIRADNEAKARWNASPITRDDSRRYCFCETFAPANRGCPAPGRPGSSQGRCQANRERRRANHREARAW